MTADEVEVYIDKNSLFLSNESIRLLKQMAKQNPDKAFLLLMRMASIR